MKHSDPSKVSGEAKKRGAKSLGTLGSGNHFIEIESVNKVFDSVAAKDLRNRRRRAGLRFDAHRKQGSRSPGLQRLSQDNRCRRSQF